MNRIVLTAIAAIVVSVAGRVEAQVTLPSGIEVPSNLLPPGGQLGSPVVIPQGATTVQLPTFNFFTISTSVMVPDSGSGFIGGVNGSGRGSRSNGPGFAQRATSSTLAGSNMSINAQIHSFRDAERELAAAGGDPQAAVARAWAARFERAKQSTAGRPTMSVAEARRLAAAR